ncbi:MAG: hypothetical protein WAL52_08785 [Candidatus Sulfotelmatobacter sp.]
MHSDAGPAAVFLGDCKRFDMGIELTPLSNPGYLSSILAGLSIQAANGSTKAELKRTAQMALHHLGY